MQSPARGSESVSVLFFMLCVLICSQMCLKQSGWVAESSQFLLRTAIHFVCILYGADILKSVVIKSIFKGK